MSPSSGRRRPSLQFPVLAALVAALLAGCSAHREAGTGDVAFRLIWDGTSDLDLLVEDPGGECIFFYNAGSPTGGILDVDCNAGSGRLCDHPIENVFWPIGTAPEGTYRLWVHAHSLIPAEAPLPYRLSVLRGEEAAWSREAVFRDHDELHGPFTYAWPTGTLEEPATDPDPAPARDRLPPRCDPWKRMLLEAEEARDPDPVVFAPDAGGPR